MMLWRLIPSKAALWAVLAALGAAFIAWLRIDARRDERRNAQLKDYEHADDIENRVSVDRADPDRLQPFEGSGWRD